jgi:aryl-alcohol dehydrogenase-like predicted oxidoreductase
MFMRTLGRSGITVSAVGFGCWPIGGIIIEDGRSVGWGEVDDDESVRALRLAFDLGVTFFDTAESYGRSEEILGRAFTGRRDAIVLATKFGWGYDRSTNTITGEKLLTRADIRRSLTGSLRRLRSDRVDLYQLHVATLATATAVEVRGFLEELVAEGLIRAYAWSTHDLDSIKLFAEGMHCTAAQHSLNVLEGDRSIVAWCAANGLASVVRTPLAMGLLGGRYTSASRVSEMDVRAAGHDWLPEFTDGRPTANYVRRIDAIRDVLCSDGRTLAQGALAWLWGLADNVVPIPGFKGIRQAEENARAMEFGPLTSEQMAQVDSLL